jgi:hypothetical protein
MTKQQNNMKSEYKNFVESYFIKENITKKNKKLDSYARKLVEWSIRYEFIDYDKLEKKFKGDILKMFNEASMIMKDITFRIIDHPLPEYQHLLIHSKFD